MTPTPGIALSDTGTGPEIVLIHGVGLRQQSWAAQRVALESDFRVLALDMPGHGDSTRLDKTNPKIIDYSDRIAVALTLALTGPAVIVGHSMGAMIALDLAVRHGGLCQGVVALNAIYRRSDAAQQAVSARAASLRQVVLNDPSALKEMAASPVQRWFGGPESPAAQSCLTWLSQADPQGYATAYTVFAEGDAPSDEQLTALPQPALFLTGTGDANSTPAMSEAMAALCPKGRALILEGAGHMAMMTHPDAVNAALRDFATEAHR